MVRVPINDLIGRSQAQVAATIEALDLSVGEVTQINSEDVGEGNVIEVDVPASELQQGEPVNLVVSAGPQARIIPEVDITTSADEFVATLEAAGVGVAQSRAFDDTVPANQFISVEPQPGTACLLYTSPSPRDRG